MLLHERESQMRYSTGVQTVQATRSSPGRPASDQSVTTAPVAITHGEMGVAITFAGTPRRLNLQKWVASSGETSI